MDGKKSADLTLAVLSGSTVTPFPHSAHNDEGSGLGCFGRSADDGASFSPSEGQPRIGASSDG